MAFSTEDIRSSYSAEMKGTRRIARRPIVTRTIVFAPNQTTSQFSSEQFIRSERFNLLRMQRANVIARNASTNAAGEFERSRKF